MVLHISNEREHHSGLGGLGMLAANELAIAGKDIMTVVRSMTVHSGGYPLVN
jgi:ketopantoate reductase